MIQFLLLVQILQKTMSIKDKLVNALIRLPLDGKVSPVFVQICTIIALVQLTGAVADQRSYVWKMTQWTDPSVYISTDFTVILGTILTLIYTLLIVVKILTTDPAQNIKNPNLDFDPLSTLTSYLRVICQTLVLGPFVKACINTFQNGTSNMAGLAAFGFALYFLVVYLISLYCSSDTTALTDNLDRKFTFLNVELYFNIFKILFFVFRAINQTVVFSLCPPYVVFYFLILILRPYFAYTDQNFRRAVFSIVAFIALIRLFNAIFKVYAGSLFVQVAGGGSFAGIVEWLCLGRFVSAIEEENLTIYQSKLLILMVQNLNDYRQYLQSYLIRHKKTCFLQTCKCRQVSQQLLEIEDDRNQQKNWYEFISSHIQNRFNLEDASLLSRTQLRTKTQEYKEVVFDLAEIYLLKLKQKNRAFLLVSQYKNHIETESFEELWDTRRARSFYYYFNLAIADRQKVQKSLSANPDRFLQFQTQFNKYMNLIFATLKSTAQFWKELLRNNANQQVLKQKAAELQEKNKQIREDYHILTNQFYLSSQIVHPITLDYFRLVLNLEDQQPHCLINQPVTQPTQPKKRQKLAKFQERMRLNSYDTQTPLCLVSADPKSFGRIQFSNNTFDSTIDKECGRALNIEELIVPQLRQWHKAKMDTFINMDGLTNMHGQAFILNSKNNILSSELMVQIIPSVVDGLRYALFVKKLNPDRRLFISKRDIFQLVYNSDSFQSVVDRKISYQNLIDGFTRQIFSQLKENKLIDIRLSGDNYFVQVLSDLQQKNLVVLQLKDMGQLQQSKIEVDMVESRIQKQQKISQYQPQNNNDYLQRKDSSVVVQTDINFEGRGRLRKKLNQEQRKQMEEKGKNSIKNIFDSIFLNYDRQYKYESGLKTFSALILLWLIIACIVIPYHKKIEVVFNQIWNDNQRYYQFANNVTDTTLKLETIHLYPTLPASLTAYNSLQPTDFLTALNAYTAFYTVGEPEVPISSLNFLANGTITPGSELTTPYVTKYLQNPINNLTGYPKADFSFPLTYQLLTPPLSQIQLDFYTFVANSIYFLLPRLDTLKQELQDATHIMYSKISNKSVAIRSPCTTVIVATIGVCIYLFLFSKKVVELTNNAYKILDLVEPETAEERLRNIQIFGRKYKQFFTEIDKNMKQQPRISQNKNLLKSRSVSVSRIEGNIQNTQMGLNNHSFNLNLDSTYNKQPKNNTEVDQIRQTRREKRKEAIFTPVAPSGKLIKIVLYCGLPILFAIGAAQSQQAQNTQASNLFDMQDQVNRVQQSIRQLRLYLLHYGVYNSQLPNSQLSNPNNMPSIVSRKIAQLTQQMNLLPSFQDNPNQFNYNDNICQLLQSGLYSNVAYNFANRNNASYCLALENGVLTQGFTAALSGFITNASQLFTSHPQIYNYNVTQIQAYLADPFFSGSSELVDYLTLHLDWMLLGMKQTLDYKEKLYLKTWTALWSVLLLLIILLYVFAGGLFLSELRKDVDLLSTYYLLLSYKSMAQNGKIREEFLRNKEQFKAIR